jgi:hypothetical protein
VSQRQEAVRPLRYIRYRGPSDQDTGSARVYCGACRLQLVCNEGLHFGWPETPDKMLTENELGWGQRHTDRDHKDTDWRWFMFCPWCGVSFPAGWWEDQQAENERTIDHFRGVPGSHKGDSHEFRSRKNDPGKAIEKHWLGTSDPSAGLCWCKYKVTPTTDGCQIVHGTDSYAAHQRREEKKYEARVAAGDFDEDYTDD